ncbi:hypothetical protein OBBRIDRAFT_887012 [Obba rivulosa]|uniref:Uncharacterized protein n=1 Tax=Obba rivulosa TaxID=1052685 RepID=A0A8E2DMS5_9APHY|nr:hypothetical protein OBBRIDRAFT_887012 [Obba rivulosa]
MHSIAYAHKIYFEQLHRSKYGMPLWRPKNFSSEVEIGDVGFYHDGGFYSIFNVTRPVDDPTQKYGCPGCEDYQPFQPQDLVTPDELSAGTTFHSKNVVRVKYDAQGGVPTANGGFSFSYKGGKGVILVLPDSATKKEVQNTLHVESYMRQHHEAWHKFAREEYGRNLEREELVLVRGWVKTTRWAVTIFDESDPSGTLNFNVGLPTASDSLELSTSHDHPYVQRIGPKRVSQTTAAGSTSQPSIPAVPKADQTVFLLYYKMKSRAAAEPRDRPGSPNDPNLIEIESVPAPIRIHDPVEDILDYILRNSNADVAIANDDDAATLYTELGIESPEDFSRTLQNTLLSIEVDDGTGLGRLALRPDLPY